MNFVYLSPHFPPNYYLFCVNLHNKGANVLGLGDIQYENLRNELRNSLTEYYYVNDMHNYDELVRALGYFTHRHGKIDRIDSLNEYWLETEAALRTDFNIAGLKQNQIGMIKRKSEMKKIFQNAGIEVADGTLLRSKKNIREFINKVGFPVVAKPDIGVGAATTYQINTDDELEIFLNAQSRTNYFVEQFVQGDIQTFDGLTDKDGNIVFYTSHQYSQGIMETVNSDDDIYYYSLRDIPEDLEAVGRASVMAFNIRERFFHIEYFRTKENNLVGLEVNLRPPGGMTTDMFNYANDIDIYEQWANIIMENKFSAEYSRPFHCSYVGRKFNKPYLHSHEDILKRYGNNIIHSEPISGVFSVALGNYGYLVRSPELTEIVEIAEYIQEKSR